MFSVDVRKIAAPNTLWRKGNMKGNIVIVYFAELMLFLGTVAETISLTMISPTQILVKFLYWQKGINPHMVNTFSSLNGTEVFTYLKLLDFPLYQRKRYGCWY